jgi:Protein of unknown function (DUF1524)
MRRLRIALAIATTVITSLTLAGCEGLAVSSGADPGATPTGASATTATTELTELTIAGGLSMAGYSRAKFHIWAAQGSGCDTRDVVLKRQGHGVKTSADCKIYQGSWTSPYNEKTYSDPQDLQIDHVVPLGDAWLSGAKDWTDAKRKAFANDLTRPQLLAVDSKDNEGKGDQDPSQWKPPNHDFWCTYATDWVSVKSYWKLTITSAEKAALLDMLATCS